MIVIFAPQIWNTWGHKTRLFRSRTTARAFATMTQPINCHSDRYSNSCTRHNTLNGDSVIIMLHRIRSNQLYFAHFKDLVPTDSVVIVEKCQQLLFSIDRHSIERNDRPLSLARPSSKPHAIHDQRLINTIIVKFLSKFAARIIISIIGREINSEK